MLINDYLREKQTTKYHLAKACNLPYGTLNDICIGKTDIAKCTGETLFKIANTLECSVDDILRERFGISNFNIDRIKELITPIAKKYKLRSVYVFGSYARNEADEDSDVDILIDREGSKVHGIFGMNELLEEIKSALGKEVDLVTVQALNQKSMLSSKKDFIDHVKKERVKIYGK